jgi:hypothetical protein
VAKKKSAKATGTKATSNKATGAKAGKAKAQPGAKKKSKSAAPKAARAAAKPASDESAAIGRVLVTQEEKLYMLFKEDYHARQIFEFLRVETVKDLEQFSPQQIVRLVSKPIQDTVLRIRRKLAEKNRHLAEDAEFVVEFKRTQSSK